MKRLLFLLIISALMIRCINDDASSYSDIKVSAQIKNPSHYNAYDGEIILDVLVGTEPFDIRWHQHSYDTISTEKDLYNIKSGWYLLSITDKKGREYSDSFFLATNDTIYPKEYLPAYPGSYWEYSDGSKIECDPVYKKVKIYDHLSWPYPWQYYVTRPHDSIYVPIWDGKPIFEYSFINYSNHHSPLIPILFDTKDETAQLNRDTRYNISCIKTITTDTSIFINNTEYNDVIITISGWLPGGTTCESFSESFLDIEKKYYARGIGLIKEEFKMLSNTEYETVREIVNWNINSPY